MRVAWHRVTHIFREISTLDVTGIKEKLSSTCTVFVQLYVSLMYYTAVFCWGLHPSQSKTKYTQHR